MEIMTFSCFFASCFLLHVSVSLLPLKTDIGIDTRARRLVTQYSQHRFRDHPKPETVARYFLYSIIEIDYDHIF